LSPINSRIHCHAYAYSNAVPIHMKWSFKSSNQNGNQEGSIIYVALSSVILYENQFSGLRAVACMRAGEQKNYASSQQSAICADEWHMLRELYTDVVEI
jgi:hypothetical protein